MTGIARILAPVDLSERSIPAAGYAAAPAGHFGAEMVLLHAFQERWALNRDERLARVPNPVSGCEPLMYAVDEGERGRDYAAGPPFDRA